MQHALYDIRKTQDMDTVVAMLNGQASEDTRTVLAIGV